MPEDKNDGFFDWMIVGCLCITALAGFGLTLAGLLGFKVTF